MKNDSPFKFKQFECSHRHSSMKIGVDAVLAGVWCDVSNCRRVLDAGCGCGVIALIVAQRCLNAQIDAIDIHEDSVKEAAANFNRSPWGARMSASMADFDSLKPGEENAYDLIVSNPPYFNAGVEKIDTSRLAARHQKTLSPFVLLQKAPELLAPGGRLAFVCPAEFEPSLIEESRLHGMAQVRTCRVSGRAGSAPKRVLMEFLYGDAETAPIITNMAIEYSPLRHTEEYIAMTKDFYLKF